MFNITRNILIFLTIVFLSQLAYFYPQLPEQVASHFNFWGEPDGWMSKSSFLVFQVILLVFILGMSSLTPFLFNNLPDAFINIPNKNYWLAPERREEAMRKFAETNDNLRVALLLLFIGINHFAFQANIYGDKLSDGVWLILCVFLLYMIYWVFQLRKTFKI
ncbi:MAG TPA: DUF1648 domain-containing protein [Pyrinomonadaceae bacterium]|jgi:uncharacterized membrane protein